MSFVHAHWFHLSRPRMEGTIWKFFLCLALRGCWLDLFILPWKGIRSITSGSAGYSTRNSCWSTRKAKPHGISMQHSFSEILKPDAGRMRPASAFATGRFWMAWMAISMEISISSHAGKRRPMLFVLHLGSRAQPVVFPVHWRRCCVQRAVDPILLSVSVPDA